MKPRNQVNEPLFYPRSEASVGIGGGAESSRGGAFDASDPKTRKSIYVNPSLSFFVPVKGWAGFYLLPTFWNFLLTGNQYADTGLTQLRTGKLNLALSGGLVGLSYSGRDGWDLEFGGSLQAKYLFTGRLFSQAGYSASINQRRTSAMDAWNAGLGYQVLPTFSLFANYSGARYTLSGNHYVTGDGVDYVNGDITSQFMLQAPWYLWGRHVITPEAGLGLRNGGGDAGSYGKAGLQYRFMF